MRPWDDLPRARRAAGAGGSSRSIPTKISARNQIPVTVMAVTPGAVTGTVKVDIGGGTLVTASITEEAAADLSLAAGDAVTVVVKASDEMIGK